MLSFRCFVGARDTALALCLAERDRPGRLEGLGDDFANALCARFERPERVATIRTFHAGPLGGLEALRWAESLFEQSHVSHCMLVGVDSYVLPETLKALHARRRLMTKANADGFVPGEAAAAVLLSRAHRVPVVIECRGLGWGNEKALPGSGIPLRGDGLAHAYRAALADAGLSFADLDYRIADLGGDPFAFKEAARRSRRTRSRRHAIRFLAGRSTTPRVRPTWAQWRSPDCTSPTGLGTRGTHE